MAETLSWRGCEVSDEFAWFGVIWLRVRNWHTSGFILQFLPHPLNDRHRAGIGIKEKLSPRNRMIGVPKVTGTYS